MKLKQILAGILTGCMLVTSVVPAYAADVTVPTSDYMLTEDDTFVTSTEVESISPVAYFDFEDYANKVEGSKLTGEVVGNGISIEENAGIKGSALKMTKQANSYFKIGQVFNARTDDFTISSWVKYDSDFSNGTDKISLYQQNGSGKTVLYLTAGNKYGTYLTETNIVSKEPVSPSEWHMVTVPLA